MKKKIILLASKGASSNSMYNGLKDDFTISTVIMEDDEDWGVFFKRRIKKLGMIKVMGQLLFQISIPRVLRLTSKQRINEIYDKYHLNSQPIPTSIIKHVSSINSPECLSILQNEQPDLIIVNGTRIIKKHILNSIDATFINIHAGITPKYRGVHGGYWSIANNDIENFGVTVHLIDKGIDTGDIIYQGFAQPTKTDNFYTYPHIQLGVGIDLVKKTILDFASDNLKIVHPKSSDSKLWYHPTLWKYLYLRFTKGIK